ncbi:hypothetical protein CDL15_Pgr020576 [Punica granatum]|uniref:TF-B3 domain-containing protein n=1 Tax=Punica granatum TaxID=22663 RepID=A0A218VWH4_PUNGR|nr:hypothetical protein CDL15_Pgr020576 [Punica granatum]
MADGMEQEKETKNLADRCSQMNGESDKAAPCLEDMMGRGHENMTVTEELLEVVKVASKKLVAEPLGVPSRTVQTPRFDVRREMPFGTCRPVEKPEWVRSHKDGESAYQKNQVPKTFVLPHWQGQRPRSLRVEVPFGPHSCHEAGESSTKLEQPLGIQASGKVKEVRESSTRGKKRPMAGRLKQPRPLKKPKEEGPTPFDPVEMPREWKDWIEREQRGTDITPVCQKELTSSDVARHYKRLLLSKKNILSLNFLREEEKEIVKLPATKGDIEKRGIPVQVIGPSRHMHELSFRRWHMKKKNGKVSIMYVLTTGVWTDFVEDNNLKEGDVVQVWSFRVGEELYMAIVAVRRSTLPEEGGNT